MAKNSTNQNPNREEFLRLIDLYLERKYTQRLSPVENVPSLELINSDQTGFKLTQDDLKNYTLRDLIQIINQRR